MVEPAAVERRTKIGYHKVRRTEHVSMYAQTGSAKWMQTWSRTGTMTWTRMLLREYARAPSGPCATDTAGVA